jgi:hypothetical protein
MQISSCCCLSGGWQSEHAYSPFTSYALSKMCNTIIAQEFQRRFDR